MTPNVDGILDTFPITEFSLLTKMDPQQVREIARRTVTKAISNHGYPYNVGKTMQAAIDTIKEKQNTNRS